MNNLRRKKRTRFKIKKVSSRKRLTVFRSNNHLYAQIINDEQGITIACVSSLEKSFKNKKNKNRKELAEDLGKEIAKRSIKNGIKEVAFDKGKYKYHGIIKILADAARTGGLDF
jgi:large subunit ribosomal protein L18|tara:strand:- start:852 stop:1193 length:342 start_codon:yes stop_codon:yes gene_type:complete